MSEQENEICTTINFTSLEKFLAVKKILVQSREWMAEDRENLTLKVDDGGLNLISTELNLGIWIGGKYNDSEK